MSPYSRFLVQLSVVLAVSAWVVYVSLDTLLHTWALVIVPLAITAIAGVHLAVCWRRYVRRGPGGNVNGHGA
jgi:hypothetical protein